MPRRHLCWLIVLLLGGSAVQSVAFGQFWLAAGEGNTPSSTELTRVHVAIKGPIADTQLEQTFRSPLQYTADALYRIQLPQQAVLTGVQIKAGSRVVSAHLTARGPALERFLEVANAQLLPMGRQQLCPGLLMVHLGAIPARESRTVEAQYVCPLLSRDGVPTLAIPLGGSMPGAATKAAVVELNAESVNPFELRAFGVPDALVTVEHTQSGQATLTYADEALQYGDTLYVQLHGAGSAIVPLSASTPGGGAEAGYFAVWLPPLDGLADALPQPLNLILALDVSSSMRGAWLEALTAAAAKALEALGAEDRFELLAHSHETLAYAEGMAPATPVESTGARAFLDGLVALGASDYELVWRTALATAARANRADVVFLADGSPVIGETDLGVLRTLIADLAGPATRVSTVALGDDAPSSWLKELAHIGRGMAIQVAAPADLDPALVGLIPGLRQPVFRVLERTTEGLPIQDLYPAAPTVVSAGESQMLLGRYLEGGPLRLTDAGNIAGSPVELGYEVSLENRPEHSPTETATLVLDEDFTGDTAPGWEPSPDQSGEWAVSDGVYRITQASGPTRSSYSLTQESVYAVEVRLRFTGSEGKVLFMRADAGEYWRVDLMASQGLIRVNARQRLDQTTSPGYGRWSVPYSVETNRWYDVRVDVSPQGVDVYVDGMALFRDLPLGDVYPDGHIGLGGHGSVYSAEFDRVRMWRGIPDAPPGVDRGPLARLWADRHVSELAMGLEGGPADVERLAEIESLSWRYLLDSPAASFSLEAPDMAMAVGRAEDAFLWEPVITAVSEGEPLSPAVPRLTASMQQNHPNPFNSSTTIAYELPMASRAELAIYSVTGQRVATLVQGWMEAGRHTARWHGGDESGTRVASGMYMYRLCWSGGVETRKLIVLQ